LVDQLSPLVLNCLIDILEPECYLNAGFQVTDAVVAGRDGGTVQQRFRSIPPCDHREWQMALPMPIVYPRRHRGQLVDRQAIRN
jgi:hypothetical protein